MIKEVFASDETVALAKLKACELLGCNDQDANFEIIQFPEKKKLGIFGGKLAQVKATLRLSVADKAISNLREVLFYMGYKDVDVSIESEEENVCYLKISGKNVSNIIGYHGETLDALQYIVSLMANNSGNNEKFCKIRIEVENYRKNRELTLCNMARKLSQKVIKDRKKITLEPMRSYERKVIHEALQDVENVFSWSEGEDMNRHVVISPTPRQHKFKIQKFKKNS